MHIGWRGVANAIYAPTGGLREPTVILEFVLVSYCLKDDNLR